MTERTPTPPPQKEDFFVPYKQLDYMPLPELRDPLASRIAAPIVGLCDQLWVRVAQLGVILFLAAAWLNIILYVLHTTALSHGIAPGSLDYELRITHRGISGLGMLCWYQYANRKPQ